MGLGRQRKLRVDDGPWNDAQLAEAISADTWRQWRWSWPARAGHHTLTVRAIDANGEVGPIGGIRQKLWGARDAGAKFFLAPSANCDEVVGHVPSGLTVASVSTLQDALAALQVISSGGDVASLPTCH